MPVGNPGPLPGGLRASDGLLWAGLGYGKEGDKERHPRTLEGVFWALCGPLIQGRAQLAFLGLVTPGRRGSHRGAIGGGVGAGEVWQATPSALIESVISYRLSFAAGCPAKT